MRYLLLFLKAYLYFLKVYLAFAVVPLDVRSSSVIDALVMVHWSAYIKDDPSRGDVSSPLCALNSQLA